MAKKVVETNIMKDLRDKEIAVLRSDVLKLKKEYAAKKLKFRLKTEKDSSSLRKLRIEIARVNTVVKEKEFLNG